MQKALITGATSGIGKELAIIMAAAGHDLVLVSRRKDVLDNLAKQLTNDHGIKVSTIAVDLSKPGSVHTLYKAVKNDGIKILVNNAGVGLKGNFFDDGQARTLQLAQLNMISLMELTQLFGNDFKQADEGRILNVGSIVAFLPGPKQPVYYASKAFVRNLSRALAYNLRNTNVTVTTLHPGVTKTDFFKSSNAAFFKGGAPARSVALLGYKAMMKGKIEVTHGFRNKLLTNLFVRVVPYRFHAPVVDRAAEV